MVHDWWKGGAWGGQPVCRVGHVMADLIRATMMVRGSPGDNGLIGDDNSYYSPGWPGTPYFKTKTGALLTTPSTVQAAAFDGLAVSSPIIAHNINEVYKFLKYLTTFDPAEFVLEPEPTTAHRYCYWVRGDDTEDPLTEADLGIDVLDEDPLKAVRDANVYAVLRRALEVPRYLRMHLVEKTEGLTPFWSLLVADRTNIYKSTTDKTPVGSTPLDCLNWILDQMTAGTPSALFQAGIGFSTYAEYKAAYENGPPLTTPQGVAAGAGHDNAASSVLYGFRGESRLPDQKILRSQISWMSNSGEASIPATVGGVNVTMQDGLVVDFEGDTEECEVSMRDRNAYFSGGDMAWDGPVDPYFGPGRYYAMRSGYWPMATFSAVYDFDYEEPPEPES